MTQRGQTSFFNEGDLPGHPALLTMMVNRNIEGYMEGQECAAFQLFRGYHQVNSGFHEHS